MMKANLFRRSFPAPLLFCLMVSVMIWMPAPLKAQGLTWGGYLLSDLRSRLNQDLSQPILSRQELRIGLTVEARPTERIHLFGEGWLRSWGLPVLSSLDALSSHDELLPVSGELREAYVDLYGFLFEPLDLRVGRQRIPWGSAEGISVIDNLNPDDLEDRWDFGRHLASEAVKLTYYGELLTLEAVYVPVFRPARLPEDVTSLMPELPLAQVRDLELSLPGNDPWQNLILGSRISTQLLGWDIALSYLYGRDDHPVAVSTVGYLAPPPNIELTLKYLRQQVAGLELVGELWDLGLWGEMAVFWPEPASQVTDFRALGGERSEERSEPYLKGVAGLDYTVPGGPYFNLQYAHGLFSENSRDSLGDYLIFALEWKLFGESLKVGPLGVALEVDDFRALADNWALVLNPEVSYYPWDNAELTLGFRWIEGREGTTFGRMGTDRELYLQGRFSF